MLGLHTEMFLLENSYLKFLMLRKRRKALKIKNKVRKYTDFSKDLPQSADEYVQKFGVKPETFNYILRKIYPHISKTSAFSPEKRLAVTLNFLASGKPFYKLAPIYKLSPGSLRIAAYEIFDAICDHLGPKYLGRLTPKKLNSVAKRYYKKFKFPNCIGTIDKEFVRSTCMKKTVDYRKTLQVPIVGIADANYKFVAVDVAAPLNTQMPFKLLDALDRELAQISPPDPNIQLPYVALGTKYIPLRRYMIKPFPKPIVDPEKKEFNHRFAEVHQVVETAFSILRNKWAVLTSVVKVDPKRIEAIIRCAFILHNILIDLEGIEESDPTVNVSKRKKKDEILPRNLNKSSTEALSTREKFKNYFFSQRREIENGYDEDTERPAKRRRIASSESSSSSDDDSDDFDFLDSDTSSDDSSSEADSDNESSSEASASEFESEPDDVENEEEVDIEDEIDIKEEPLDDDSDEDIKPDIADVEVVDIGSSEQSNVLDIKPDPDSNGREVTADGEEPNSTSRDDEVKVKEEPGINSSTT